MQSMSPTNDSFAAIFHSTEMTQLRISTPLLTPSYRIHKVYFQPPQMFLLTFGYIEIFVINTNYI